MAIFGIKGLPWHYKGVYDVSDCKTSADVMATAKLDWTVDKCPLYAKIGVDPTNDEGLDKINETLSDLDGHIHGKDLYVECPNAYSTYRMDKNIPLGVVKNKYTIVQNTEAFKFFDDAIGANKAIWQTAGLFGRGERVFVSAKLPNNILVKGDPVENYLIFTNSHDGSGGVKILFSPIRVVCKNTLTAAIRSSTNYVTMRHTNGVHDKLNLASEVLGICDTNQKYLSDVYNAIANITISDDIAMKYICEQVISNEDIINLKDTGHTFKELCYRDNRAFEDSKISKRKLNILSSMYAYYHDGAGQRNILGTGWGLVNAVTGYYSNVDNIENSKRMDSLLYGDKSRKIQTAFADIESY